MAKASDFACVFCGRWDVTVHRINPKGQKGVWACDEHIGQTDTVIDTETRRLIHILEGKPTTEPEQHW
jgi:hypothetical protein